MNIYRGCTHGCIYCDSRSKCYHFTHPFEDIEVKQNAPELLAAALKSKRKKCMIIRQNSLYNLVRAVAFVDGTFFDSHHSLYLHQKVYSFTHYKHNLPAGQCTDYHKVHSFDAV